MSKKSTKKGRMIGINLMVCVALFLLCNSVYAQDYVKKGLVSYWSFDEGEGEIAKDSVGTNNGQIHGAVWVDGIKGKALSFDGVDDYVDCGEDGSLDLGIVGEITLEACVKLSRDLDVEKTELVSIITKGPYNNSSQYLLGIRYGQKMYTDGLRPDGSYTQGRGDVMLAKNVWYHLALTRDSSGTKFYVNGELKGRGLAKITQGKAADVTTQIGAEDEHYYFPGIIDEVRIYNRALSAAEIKNHYEINNLLL